MSPGIPSFPVIPAWVETGGEKDQGGKRKDRWRRRVRHAKKGMGRVKRRGQPHGGAECERPHTSQLCPIIN